MGAGCASPSVPETRSMADKDKKDKEAKPERQPKARLTPEQQAKADKAAQAKQRAAQKAAASGEKKPREPEERVTPRLRTHFDADIRKKLAEQFGYKSNMQVPILQKIVLNMGI